VEILHTNTDQKAVRVCNAATWNSVAKNRNNKSILQKLKLVLTGVLDLFDISNIPMVWLKGKV